MLVVVTGMWGMPVPIVQVVDVVVVVDRPVPAIDAVNVIMLGRLVQPVVSWSRHRCRSLPSRGCRPWAPTVPAGAATARGVREQYRSWGVRQ